MGVDPRIGWWLMELPCTCVFVFFFFVRGGPQTGHPVPWLLGRLFVAHYIYRGWIFPALIRVHGKSQNFDAVVALGGWFVTCVHGYLSARWYSTHGRHLVSDSWAKSLRFRLGLGLYLFGMAYTVYHDHLVRNLRPCPNGERYCVPTGGFYDFVTCAHYFSELIAWFGFALMGGGPNGAFIFLVSLVNLAPRAATTHSWYLTTFTEYSSLGRTRLIPFVW